MCPLKQACHSLRDSVISLLMQKRVANSNLRVVKLKNIHFPSPPKCTHPESWSTGVTGYLQLLWQSRKILQRATCSYTCTSQCSSRGYFFLLENLQGGSQRTRKRLPKELNKRWLKETDHLVSGPVYTAAKGNTPKIFVRPLNERYADNFFNFRLCSALTQTCILKASLRKLPSQFPSPMFLARFRFLALYRISSSACPGSLRTRTSLQAKLSYQSLVLLTKGNGLKCLVV